MAKPRLALETQRLLNEKNFYCSSLHQPEGRIPNDGRRLKRVAQKGDPWVAQLFYPDDAFMWGDQPIPWYATFIQWGEGDTADEAVLDALRKATGVEGTSRQLAGAMDRLMGAMNDHRNSLSLA